MPTSLKYMIFKTKIEIANYLKCYRQKIDSKIKKWEVKILYLDWKKIGYVYVKEFIIYLLS